MKRLALPAASIALTASTPAGRSAAEVHAILVELPPAWAERELETAAQRSVRLRAVAGVIAPYPRHVQDRLIAKAYGETRLAAYTAHDCTGKVPPGAAHCDRGAARSHWQLHRGVCPRLWACSAADAVRVGAACAAAHLERAFRRCGGDPAKSFAAYGWGRCVSTANSERKAALYRRLGAMP